MTRAADPPGGSGPGFPAGLQLAQPGALEHAAARARAFALRSVAPVALELDRRLEHDHDHFPWELVRAGAADGWLGAAIPRVWGGGGLGIAEMSVAIEELCAVDAGVANIFGAHGLGLLPLMLGNDLRLAARVMLHVTRAEREGAPVLCAFAITEPGAGSDVEEIEGLAKGDVRTRARRVNGGYRLSGRKVFISNGSVAEHVVVFAALDMRSAHDSWTAFLVRRGSPGLDCPRVERKLGQRACPAAELVLDDVFVPSERRIGDEASGWELTRRVLAVSRGPVGAIATGIARGAFEAALDQVRELGAAAEPWHHDSLARMVVRIRSARAAYLEAARHADEALLPAPWLREAAGALGRFGPRIDPSRLARALDGPAARERWAHQVVLGATAKIVGSDAAMAVTTAALDLVPPGAGRRRALAEKCFRDAKLTQIYEGTNEINLRAIGHEAWHRPAG